MEDSERLFSIDKTALLSFNFLTDGTYDRLKTIYDFRKKTFLSRFL